MRAKTVSVNGTVYDAKTGQPVRLERSGHGIAKNAHDVHSKTQHSRTLNRRYVKRSPAAAAPSAQTIDVSRKKHQPQPAATHASVKRFTGGGDAITVKHKTASPSPEKLAAISHHPLVTKVVARESAIHSMKAAPRQVVTPSQVIKKHAIDEATSKMAPKRAKKAPKLAMQRSTTSRRLSLASTALAFMLFSGYLTYLYMPNLSTRVAASQAGINAEYPSYHPSGYRLAGPIAYQPGEVSMKFAANAGPSSYTLTQSRSAWDSSAVLENYIQPKAKDDYSTTQVNGLTIYSYGTNAAWVNGGVLYTINGDAPLSNEQVQRIAKSLSS